MWSWAHFKYEKLSTFCFFGGILGHTNKFCEKFFDYPDKSIEKLLGVCLWASIRQYHKDIGKNGSAPIPLKITPVRLKVNRKFR